MKDRLGFGGNGGRWFGDFWNGKNSRHLEEVPR